MRQLSLFRRRRHRFTRVRLCVGAVLAVWISARPVNLTSLQWWWSPDVVRAIGLTSDQRHRIAAIYARHLMGRRRCIERLVEASNRVDQLIRDGVYEEDTLRQTQKIATAAAEERALARLLSDEIGTVLSSKQRDLLARLRPGRILE